MYYKEEALEDKTPKQTFIYLSLFNWSNCCTTLRVEFFLSTFRAASSSKSNAINQYLLFWVPHCRSASVEFPIFLVKVKLITLNSLAAFFFFVLALNSPDHGCCIKETKACRLGGIERLEQWEDLILRQRLARAVEASGAYYTQKWNKPSLKKKSFLCVFSKAYKAVVSSLGAGYWSALAMVQMAFFDIACVSLCAA